MNLAIFLSCNIFQENEWKTHEKTLGPSRATLQAIVCYWFLVGAF